MFEIAYLPEEQLNRFHSDFRIVADYFVHSRNNPEYRPINPQKFRHVDELLKLMSVLTQDERFEAAAAITNKEDIDNMDKVLDYREAVGEARGIAIGEARQAEKVEAANRRADALEEENALLKARLAKYESVE